MTATPADDALRQACIRYEHLRAQAAEAAERADAVKAWILGVLAERKANEAVSADGKVVASYKATRKFDPSLAARYLTADELDQARSDELDRKKLKGMLTGEQWNKCCVEGPRRFEVRL